MSKRSAEHYVLSFCQRERIACSRAPSPVRAQARADQTIYFSVDLNTCILQQLRHVTPHEPFVR